MRVFLCAALSCFASVLNASNYAKIDMLEELPGSFPKEVVLSTHNVPEHAAVVVHCEVVLPHAFTSNFSFYVTPRAGEFGAIEDRTFYSDTKQLEVVNIGSKIYTTNNKYKNQSSKTFFYITDVKQTNEAIVMDLSNLPDATTVECTF